MVILHLTTYLQGGAGRCITDLALTQQRSGMRPIVVASASPEGGYQNYPEYVATLRAAGISVHLLDSLFARDSARNLSVAAALSGILPARDVSVVHAHASTPARIGCRFAADASSRPPVLQTMHGWGTRKSPEQAVADLATMGQLDAIVTTSDASSRQLAGMGLAAKRMAVIPCGLAATAPAAAADEDEVSRALHVARERGAYVLLCIGSVTRNKNQALLLDALPALLRAQPEQTLFCAVIGEGVEMAKLSRRARDLQIGDCVRFYGHRANAASYLPDADLLVLPSRSEGQGLVVLEAFRAGTLVAVSDAPALTELVSGSERGVTFASDSAEALAGAIRRARALSISEREKITASARTYFRSRFTTQAMHESHEALYRSLLADRPVGLMSLRQMGEASRGRVCVTRQQ